MLMNLNIRKIEANEFKYNALSIFNVIHVNHSINNFKKTTSNMWLIMVVMRVSCVEANIDDARVT